DPKGRPYADLRWSKFKNFVPADMFEVVGEHAFPFLRTIGDDSTYAHHMKDARFAVLSRPRAHQSARCSVVDVDCCSTRMTRGIDA
ncbi:MAG TPA: hypothetical protein VG871_21935, partial [Vicinamibacterales bacterium]|nr:hypothetical protein [Vicinamibacterales bacterium]